MSEQDRWTIGRLLQWTTDYLKQHGSSSPRLDAEVLLSEARGCQRIQLYTAFDEEPVEAIRTKFRELVKRRAAGEPVAYLVGRREFFSLSFQVNNAVLVPRPETEFVVIAALDAIKEMNRGDATIEVADVGTGSGAIAISVAKHAPRCRVTAIDLSTSALDVARKNAVTHEVSDRIEFVEGDLFAQLPEDRTFDVILSNPPYVAESELDLLSKETREHEPRLALVSGPTGLEVITRLVQESSVRLRAGGIVVVEISPMIEAQARQLFTDHSPLTNIKVTKDLAGLPRVVTARRLE